MRGVFFFFCLGLFVCFFFEGFVGWLGGWVDWLGVSACLVGLVLDPFEKSLLFGIKECGVLEKVGRLYRSLVSLWLWSWLPTF